MWSENEANTFKQSLLDKFTISFYLDCVGVLGLRGVNGFACGFKVDFFKAPKDDFSFDDAAVGGVESVEFPIELMLLTLLFTLFTLCGVVT